MLNIAIVAGGDSGEYEISIGSGRQVELLLDRSRFKPFLIIVKGDHWDYTTNGLEFPIDKNDFSLTIGGEKIRFNAVFNAIHGTPGENGKLQGYFDILGIPYTSCDHTTSALTFNKGFCKAVVASAGRVELAKSLHLFRRDFPVAADVMEYLSLPVFVKPNNGGSSVGMSKVNREDELDAALQKAFREDNEILVEEFIPGRELTCGVLRTRNEVIALPVTEVISRKEFFDYEAKYTVGLAQEVVPAKIPPGVSLECRNISCYLYEWLNCKGVVRFDYILHDDRFYFLEVNTVPGLSAASIVPKMAKAYGWSMTELFSRLLDEILPRT
jgi:D-alanine-D-alanine ligase